MAGGTLVEHKVVSSARLIDPVYLTNTTVDPVYLTANTSGSSVITSTAADPVYHTTSTGSNIPISV